MSAVEWTDEVREAADPFVTRLASCGYPSGIKDADEILAALTPHVAGMLDQARAEALREAADRVPVANDGLIGGRDLRNWLRYRAAREAEGGDR